MFVERLRAVSISIAISSIAISSPVFGQFANYSDAPYRYAANPSRFSSLFSAGATQTVRMAIFGDSQETSPGGAGAVYIPRMNYEAYKLYGNTPETPFLGGGGYGGGNPYAEFLAEGSAPNLSASRVPSDQILPGVTAFKSLNTNGNVNATGQYYGQLTELQHDAVGVNPGSNLPASTNFFNPTGSVKAQIFAATNASSGEINYRALPNDASTPTFFVPATTTGTLALGLESATPGIKSSLTASLNYAGKKYMQLEVSGTDNTKPTDVFGMRFVNESHPQGMVFTDFAAGGYRTSSILQNHANSGALYKALGYDAAIIHMGANDVGGNSAATYKADTEALIAAIRTWTSDANYRVILIADPDVAGLSPTQRAQYDQYVGAQYQIALSDPNVMLVNSRRMMNDLGWNASDSRFTDYVVDGVHSTALGARTLAAAEFAAMSTIPEPTSLAAIVLGGIMMARRSARHV